MDLFMDTVVALSDEMEKTDRVKYAGMHAAAKKLKENTTDN
jgi:hypothetical protein